MNPQTPSYRKPQIPAQQQNITIQSLQSYISQLTTYINQNNQVYNKNLHTINEFYHQQIDELNNTVAYQQEQIIKIKNQLAQAEALLLNRNQEIKLSKEKINDMKIQINQLEDKNRIQRSAKQRAYEDVDRIRDDMLQKIQAIQNRCNQAQAEQRQMKNTIKDKNSEVDRLKKDIEQLQNRVAQRYSMPDKIQSLQIQAVRQATNMSSLKQKINELERQKDFTNLQLNKLRKQSQKLKIQLNKAKGDQSYQIQRNLKIQRQKFYQQIQKQKLENQRLTFQLNDLENKLKTNIKQKQKLEIIVTGLQKSETNYNKQIQSLKNDKDIYLDQFRKLKLQYQSVIANLQESIPHYQTKNWALQQQNQQLNTQLTGLQQLLRQVKAMNDMQPFKKQYRQWAQLNLLADKSYVQQKQQNKINQSDNKQIFIKRNQGDQLDADWKKIMNDIESISV